MEKKCPFSKRCVHEDTLVYTVKGEIQIKNLKQVPPSLVTLPPEVAEVRVIPVTAVVVTVAAPGVKVISAP